MAAMALLDSRKLTLGQWECVTRAGSLSIYPCSVCFWCSSFSRENTLAYSRHESLLGTAPARADLLWGPHRAEA